MDTLEHLHRLFVYDDWANRETLESLKKTGAPPPRSLRCLAYPGRGVAVVGPMELNPRAALVWPEMTLAQCEEQIASIRQIWQSYLGGLDTAKLSRRIAYRNTKGESWENTVQNILLHVVMHSAYHRGQIAADMRAAGHEPAYADFIHSVRQGLVE